MTERPHGKFRRSPRANFDTDTIEDILDLTANGISEPIVCRVSREALEDRAGARGEVPILELFATYCYEFYEAVDRRLKLGQREADGTFLIRTGELKPLA